MRRKLKSLSLSERHRILGELEVEGVKLPSYTAGNLVSVRVQEEEDMRTRIEVLTPSADGVSGTFDYKFPKLADTGLDDTETAKAIQRGVVAESYLRFLALKRLAKIRSLRCRRPSVQPGQGCQKKP